MSNLSNMTEDDKLGYFRQNMEGSSYKAAAKDDFKVATDFSTNVLFPRLKFITCKEQLDSIEPESVMDFVTENLYIQDNNKVKWWNQHKEQFHVFIRSKRNNVTQSMRKTFKGKDAMLYSGNTLFSKYCFSTVYAERKIARAKEMDNGVREDMQPEYTLGQIQGIQVPTNKNLKAYCWALNLFMPCIVGMTKWNNSYLLQPFSTFIDVTGKFQECRHAVIPS